MVRIMIFILYYLSWSVLSSTDNDKYAKTDNDRHDDNGDDDNDVVYNMLVHYQ